MTAAPYSLPATLPAQSTPQTAPATSLPTFLKELRQRIDPNVEWLGDFRRPPCRRGRNVSQEEVAEAVGVSRVWYSTLESRPHVRTSSALLDRLSRALMTTPFERATLFCLAIPELDAVPGFSLAERDARG